MHRGTVGVVAMTPVSNPHSTATPDRHHALRQQQPRTSRSSGNRKLNTSRERLGLDFPSPGESHAPRRGVAGHATTPSRHFSDVDRGQCRYCCIRWLSPRMLTMCQRCSGRSTSAAAGRRAPRQEMMYTWLRKRHASRLSSQTGWQQRGVTEGNQLLATTAEETKSGRRGMQHRAGSEYCSARVKKQAGGNDVWEWRRQ